MDEIDRKSPGKRSSADLEFERVKEPKRSPTPEESEEESPKLQPRRMATPEESEEEEVK